MKTNVLLKKNMWGLLGVLFGLIFWIGAILLIVFGSLAIHYGSYKNLSKGWGIVLVVIGVVLLIGGIPCMA